MKTKIIVLAILVIVFSFTSNIPAQQTDPDAHQAESSERSGHAQHHAVVEENIGQDESADMMSEHGRMMSMMQKMDQELASRVAAMNSATGDREQIEAMKAVINELVSQRKRMHQKMMGMQGKMCKMMGRMKARNRGEKPVTLRMGQKEDGKDKNMIIIIQE